MTKKPLDRLTGLGYTLKKTYYPSDRVQVWELSHVNPDKPRFYVAAIGYSRLNAITFSYKHALILRKDLFLRYPSLKAKLRDLVF